MTFSSPFAVRLFINFYDSRAPMMNTGTPFWKMAVIGFASIIAILIPASIIIHYRTNRMQRDNERQMELQSIRVNADLLTKSELDGYEIEIYHTNSKDKKEKVVGKKNSRENLLGSHTRDPTETPVAATKEEAIESAKHPELQIDLTELTVDTIQPSLEPAQVKESETDFNVCTICLESYQEGEKLRILPCKHRFHMSCVDAWLTTKSGTCPLCRDQLK
jgi:hypothetical protein